MNEGNNIFIGSYKVMDFVLIDMDLNKTAGKTSTICQRKVDGKDFIFRFQPEGPLSL